MKIPTTLRSVLVSAALLLAAGPAWAHHALATQFDPAKTITLKGTITRMDWRSPHGWIHIDVKRPDGQVENWGIETGGQSRMKKRGLNRADFQPGIEIIVGGFPARDGSQKAAGMTVTFVDRVASLPNGQAAFSLGR